MRILAGAAFAAALSLAGITQAAVVGGAVTGGTALGFGGVFVKENPGPGFSVGNDTKQGPNLWAFDEVQSYVLLADLTPDVGATILAGTRISSHYVYFDPVGSQNIGYVDFSGAVLGILTTAPRLTSTDSFLGRAGVTYLSPDLRGIEEGDTATFLGKRVNTDLTAGTPGDYIRVLTAFQPVPEPASWLLMIAGFGIAGAALRRGRRATGQAALAK
jgi:hypothetical protein